MSESTQPDQASPVAEDADWRSLVFFKKIDRDVWESWTWTAVGLFASMAAIWTVVFLKLGWPSLKAFALVPWTGMMALPIVVWGLIRSLMNPPVFRPSRTIGFLALTAVAFSANTPLFPVPLSTDDWTPSASFVLPVKGEWYTLSGGESMDTNELSNAPAMRYGHVMTVRKDGARFKNKGKDLKDYYCYGQPIYAPAAGEVLSMHDGMKDNPPRVESQKGYQGNHVVLKVAPDVYFFVFNLKAKSVRVKPGQQVAQGEVLGECGASGSATMPQVQFHFQNSPDFPLSEGLPVRYTYKKGQALVESGLPRGENVGAGEDGELITTSP